MFLIKLLFFSNMVFGFTILESSSPEAVWTEIPLKIYYDSTNCPSGFKSAITDAFDLWNNVATSRLKFELVSDEISLSALTLYNGGATQYPAITCDPNFAADFPDLDANFIAGYGFYSRVGGTMSYGGMVINTDPTALARAQQMNHTELTLLVAHEMGHVVGLGHASTQPCLMYYSLGVKAEARLSQDDEDAISYLYPRDELGKDKMFGCAAVHRTNLSAPLSFRLGLLFILPLIIYVSLRLIILRKRWGFKC